MPASTGVLEASPVLSVEEAIHRAGQFLLDQQDGLGAWCGELEADTTLESDTVKMWHLLGRVDLKKQEQLVRWILKQELPGGGWPIYAGGPAELNATVKAHVALRLAGLPEQNEVLRRSRAAVLRLGGLERINSFEKTYLALFGLYPWDQVPALPPEVVLLPTWFPVNIYEISYWSRAILIPLAVLYGLRPSWKKAAFTVDDLWVNPAKKRERITNFQKGGAVWRVLFLISNQLLQWHEKLPWKPFRRAALAKADRWMNERMVGTDGLGAIFPAMINAVFALKALGYGDGDPLFEQAVKEMERLEMPAAGGLRVQPCFSALWDTAISLTALGKAALPGSGPALEQAVNWLKESEIRIWGDWRIKNPKAKPGGWAFEFRNPFYPDVDDTAQVLLGFQAFYGKPAAYSIGAYDRGLEWTLSMQNRDGGWSSYDKNNDKAVLNHFPFADHNAMLDPSACDITGRVLEMLAGAGLTCKHPAVRRGIAYLKKNQEPDGTWFGRWGVNYIYGTWLALRGLQAVGEPLEEARYQRAGAWLISCQNPDGGWGESCRSYDDPSQKGRGLSTASQTSWALMALISLEKMNEPAFRKGIEYLLRTQQQDGNWAEEPFTGTGFPRVFYLKYHLYRTYFPLLALLEAREFLKE
ncbi:MAG: squalene--hopene cyclase [Candidatus Omnitrophota bacterium]|nr:squalene--hopene cyclase [Candidatus Omnitrophota bacterium]